MMKMISILVHVPPRMRLVHFSLSFPALPSQLGTPATNLPHFPLAFPHSALQSHVLSPLRLTDIGILERPRQRAGSRKSSSGIEQKPPSLANGVVTWYQKRD